MLIYRPLEERDLEIRVKWMNDPRIYETMHYTPPITLENTLKWFSKNRNSEQRRDFVLEDDGEVVVMNGLTGLEPPINKVESYTFVKPDAKGKGYGTKSELLMCGYAFYHWTVNKIWSFVDSDNEASLYMSYKIGYKKEGVLRDELFKNGKYMDRYYLGMLKSDFNIELYNQVLKETVLKF